MIDDLSFAPRSELMARYRKAYAAVNGRQPVLIYHNGRYQVQDGECFTHTGRKGLVEALVELERRAGLGVETLDD